MLKRLIAPFSVLALAAVLCVLRPSASSADPKPNLRWYKGNTHTHTTNSDGKSSPEVVAQWYADHGYDFLVLSDHNKLTLPADVRPKVKVPGGRGFLLVPGEEITNKKAVHVNGIGLTEVIASSASEDRSTAASEAIAAVRKQGGVPHLNHPNFGWAFNPEAMQVVRDLRHFEVFNGHPAAHNDGDEKHLSAEALWDLLLTEGRRIFCVAVDDAHHFKKWGPADANPGRGWIVIHAAQMTPKTVVDAIDRGDFYASSGVELDDLEASPKSIRLKIRPAAGRTYKTAFIGPKGRVLAETEGETPAYEPKGGEGYVRARVTDSSGAKAWIQPVFLP